MSDAPEEEVPKAAKTARKRPAKRVTKSAPAAAAAETVVNLSAPEPLVPAPPVAERAAAARREAPERQEPSERSEGSESDEQRSERSERSHSQRSSSDFSDHGDPVATFGEPPSSDSQGGGSKKRRRRKKNKHGQQPPQGGGGGGSQQVFQTAPTQGYAVSAPAPFQEPREAPHVEPVSGPAPAMHAAPRPKIDPDQIAKKAWKIFLAEVSEEGLALIGDNDARELSRRSFRLAEVFVEEAARRQHR